jgi:hypothetical protein
MRKLLATGFIIAIAACAPVVGQSSSKPKPEELAQTVSEAYKAKALADLDKKHLAASTVTLVIEHSLTEGRIATRRFKNLAAIDTWLTKQEREEGSPFRQTMPLLRCARGRCSYNFDGGILHNQLYLHDIYYSSRNRRLLITKIHLLDGD